MAKLLNSGRILVNGSEFYCGNSTNGLCKLALSSDIPESAEPYVHPATKQCNYTYTHPSEIQCNAASEISSLKSSVSSGKAQIASAITGKGVSTSSSASFSTMASNIAKISGITSLEKAYLSTSNSYTYIVDFQTLSENATLSVISGGTVNTRNRTINLADELSILPGYRLPPGNFSIGFEGSNTDYSFLSFDMEPVRGLSALVSGITLTCNDNGWGGDAKNVTVTYSKSGRYLDIRFQLIRIYDSYEDDEVNVSNSSQTHRIRVTFPSSMTVYIYNKSNPTSSDSYSTMSGNFSDISNITVTVR